MTHELTVGANSSPVDKCGFERLSNKELLARTEWLSKVERAAACDLVLHIAELDRRRAAVEAGYNSTFDYCVHRLRYGEGTSYRLIRAARAVRTLPAIEAHLRAGSLSLEAVAILHPYLQDADAAELIRQCASLSTREVEALLAKRKTAPPVRDSVRHIGMATPPPPAVPTPPAAAAEREPLELSSEPVPAEPRCLVRVSFAADERFFALLKRAKEVMNNKYPEGRLENILGDALEALLDRKDMDRIIARRVRARALKVGRLARRKAKELAGAKFVSLREQRPID